MTGNDEGRARHSGCLTRNAGATAFEGEGGGRRRQRGNRERDRERKAERWARGERQSEVMYVNMAFVVLGEDEGVQ